MSSKPPQTDGPLSRADWDFRAVNDAELIACCLWEYSRECQSLAFCSEEYRVLMRRLTKIKDWGGLPSDDVEFEEYCRGLKRREKRAGFCHTTFLGRFWNSDVGFIRYYSTLREVGGAHARPWQDLHSRHRSRFCAELNQRDAFNPCAPSVLTDLEQLWIQNSKGLTEVRARPRDENDDSEDFLLYSPSSPMRLSENSRRERPRRTAVSFTIDFSRYSDREIVTAFESWVRSNRPRCWRKPKNAFPTISRGKKMNDYRVALERLGMMRLLHWYSPSFLKMELPEAWRMYGPKSEMFRKEIKAALAFFRAVFPFLPRTEFPLSFPRYLTWITPMLRAADGVTKSTRIS